DTSTERHVACPPVSWCGKRTAVAPRCPVISAYGVPGEGAAMGPRITIVGGGSYQWTPKLLVDFVNTPALRDAHLVLHDIDPAPLPRMVDLAHHLADVRGITLTASGTTDRGAALDGADFVVVNISTGGFASMRHDLEIPERHGVRQTVGDSVGPGGVVR